MVLKLSVARVEALVWVLIYAGLLIFALGLALRRDDAGLGHVFWIAGLALAAGGVVLILVRARMMLRKAADRGPPSTDSLDSRPESKR
jgi:vacuolar-type H+-ATPase subunit I/STV1